MVLKATENLEGTLLRVLVKLVGEVDDAPDATAQELVVHLDIVVVDADASDVEVEDLSLVGIVVLVEPSCHLVDDFELSSLPYLRLDFLGFVGAHIVFGKDLLHHSRSVLYVILVVGGAVHAE